MDSKQTQDNTGEERERGQNVPQSLIRVAIESFPASETPPEERQREKKKKSRFKRYGLAVNVGTLIAVIWYAYVATQQRNAMINANEVTQRLFQAEIGDFGVANLSRESVGWAMKNTGKTTAEKVRWDAKLMVTSLLNGATVQSAEISSTPINVKDGTPALAYAFPLSDIVGRNFESESFKIDVSITYENGFGKEIHQNFCREIIGKESSASLDFYAEECFNSAFRKQKRIEELRASKKKP